MFDKEYSFKGTHADKVVKLTAKFDDKNSIFKRNLDVYMMAPIVGFLYQRKAESNNDGEQKTTKIFPEQLIGNRDDLAFNYRLIMLLDKKYEPDFVVESNNNVYLIEVKADAQLDDPIVVAKKERALSYCKLVSAWAKETNHKEWIYVIIPSSKISNNSTFKHLVEMYSIKN